MASFSSPVDCAGCATAAEAFAGAPAGGADEGVGAPQAASSPVAATARLPPRKPRRVQAARWVNRCRRAGSECMGHPPQCGAEYESAIETLVQSQFCNTTPSGWGCQGVCCDVHVLAAKR